jgi:hypothetical protein
MVGHTNHSVVYPSNYGIKKQILGAGEPGKEFFMREEGFRQAIRLRLLGLVLALALTWYALNPAPSPVRAEKRETDPHDEGRLEANIAFQSNYHTARSEAGVNVWSVKPTPRTEESADDLEWPEIIEF